MQPTQNEQSQMYTTLTGDFEQVCANILYINSFIITFMCMIISVVNRRLSCSLTAGQSETCYGRFKTKHSRYFCTLPRAESREVPIDLLRGF